MNRQKLILSVLLVVFLLAAVSAYLRMPRQKTAEKRTPGLRTAVPAGKSVQVDDKKLHLEILDRECSRFSGYRRNIFQPIFYDEAKVAAMKKIVKPPPPPPPPPPPVVPPPPVETEADRLKKELAQFSFLGFLKKGRNTTVFLSLRNELFLVKKGDNFAAYFTVADISDEDVTIRLKSGEGERVIPLTEAGALTVKRR